MQEAIIGRRPRRTHLLAAASITALIFTGGFAIRHFSGRGQESAALQQPAASSSATPFGRAFARGIEAMRLGDAAAAAAAFNDARSINPHIPEAQINLGFAYLAMQKAREAATAFERALTIDPKKTNAYYGLGSALDAAGDREGAIGAMRAFVHIASEDDPFKRKALSALWEWEAAEKAGAPKQAGTGAKAETAALASKDMAQGAPAFRRDASPNPETPTPAAKGAPAHLPAIAESPDPLSTREGMISIVNVWASWCGPCRAEMPSLQAFAAALDPTRFRLIGLNVDRDRDFAREFIRDTGVSFANFWDGKGAFARDRFGIDSYPQTLFLDSNGAVLARVGGAREWRADNAQAAVEEILASGRQSKEPK